MQHQVDHQRHTHHLDETFVQSGADVLGTENGGTHREELIDEEYERHQLVVEAHRSHAVVAVTAEHDGVDGTQHHDEGHLDEHRNGDHPELSFKGIFLQSLIF